MTISQSTRDKYRKQSEYNGETRPETGVHPPRTNHTPTPEEALRLVYLTGDESGATTKIDPKVFVGE